VSSAKEALEREITELEEQIRVRRAALAQLTGSPIPAARGRFSPPMRPHKAARVYLEETQHAVTQSEIIDALVAGGASDGKKRGRHNIRISLEKCVELGTLIDKDGKLGLPEWTPDKF
jgi:hypothetical protein